MSPPAPAVPASSSRVDALRHRVRDVTRRQVRSARATVRARTGRAGDLPSFVVAGAQRCGTTSLHQDLLRHPQVRGAAGKELQFFTLHHERGLDWYRGCFPRLAPGQQTFESTPYYLFDPAAPARLAAALPAAKVVVLLRDPVTRALSHHRHSVRTGAERLPLAQALAAEPQRLAAARALGPGSSAGHRALRAWSYVARGRYGEQLSRWVAAVGRERLHVVRSEELHADPAREHARLLAFLGLDVVDLGGHARHTRRPPEAGDPMPEARALLAGAFEGDLPLLLATTGWERGW
ncbi:sulfotransferase [Pseudokineococcus sp. 1T1Z-3]|uniref:sulfotransferase n=1 Tax=Pseudokineococcus sp. 1T1Z-3 TaxID=3132745 RepID=UPI0030B738EA